MFHIYDCHQRKQVLDFFFLFFGLICIALAKGGIGQRMELEIMKHNDTLTGIQI